MRHPKVRLTNLSIQKHSKRGTYADGHGLYLQVSKNGTKSWLFRFNSNGKNRKMGLGSIDYVPLAKARMIAIAMQQKRLEGIDPLEEKRSRRIQNRVAQANHITFDECAKQFIEKKNWTNLKHRAQWVATLKAHASPVFGNMPVSHIDVNLVIRVLEPIWFRVPETASRVRGRIENILAYATARGFRAGENPARWKGHLDAVFEKRSEIAPVRHMPALPWRDIPRFMSELRKKQSQTARATELLILTALRPGEAVAAKFCEIDIEQGVWTVPGERMKKKVEHRIPLSTRALEIIRDLSLSGSEFLFPGHTDFSKSMTTAAMLKLVKDMRPDIDITSHGFRSCFRDWAAESTNFPNEVCEAALAHKIENKVEAAYRRGDLFLKRTLLMQKWAEYCATSPAEAAVLDIVHRKPTDLDCINS